MIAHLSGTIIDIRQNALVIENNGVGYEVFVPQHVTGASTLHSETSLWINTIVRETSFELFGFVERVSYELFGKLITISGVGPRSALNIIDIAPSDNLIHAIQSNDPSLLTKVSGIGKKTAEKIVLELRDKLGDLTVDDIGGSSRTSGDIDVLDALIALGYSQAQARDALANVPNELEDTNEKIKKALQFLG